MSDVEGTARARVRRAGLAAATAGGIIGSMLVAPTAAHAVVGLQRAFGNTPSLVTTSHTLLVACPPATLAIGGLAAVSGAATDIHVVGIWPEGNRVVVTAVSDRNPATAAWALSGTAFCVTLAFDYQYVASAVTNGATEAVCPAGKVVIGMGARVAFGRLVHAIPFGPGAGTQALTSVTAATEPTIAGLPPFVQALAVCANAARTSRLAKGQVVGTGPTHVVTAACPAGTQLHSLGGFIHYPNQVPPASHALFTAFGSVFLQPNVALVIAREKVDAIPAQSWGLDAWAICAP